MKLELQYKANEELLDIKEEADMEKQKFELLKTKIAFVRKEDAFINPEKAKARQAAIIKKQEDEEAAKELREQIPPAEEVALIENFQKAATSSANPDKAIKTLIDDQKSVYNVAMVELKKASVDKTKTKEEKVELETKVAIEQKKYLALQQEVVKIEDKKIEAKKVADQAAQDAEDKKNAIPLTVTEKEKIYTDLKKYTYVRMTEDPKENLQRRKASLVQAEVYASSFNNDMINKKILM